MWKFARNSTVNFGGNLIHATPILVAYDQQPILSLVLRDETGYLGVDCRLYDEHGDGIATIKHNQIYRHKGKKDRYKLEGNANRYTLIDRETGEVYIDIKEREAAEPMSLEVSAKLYLPNGVLFEATPEAIVSPTQNYFIGNLINNYKIAFNIPKEGGLQVGVN